MAVQVSYPGVYIDEFAPGAPIQGVSTSITAFIGTALKGELDEPTKITNWDQFVQIFGEGPAPQSYLWHAVRGFFDNDGQTCYVVRASNGTYTTAALPNRDGDNVLTVTARQPGAPANPVSIQVTPVNRIAAANAAVYQPNGNATAIDRRSVTMTDAAEAAQFRPGDEIDIGGTRALIAGVSADKLRLSNDLSGVAAGPVQLADLDNRARTLRILHNGPVPEGVLVPGAILTITQNGGITRVVASVQAEYLLTNPPITTYRVNFRQPLGRPIDMTTAATVQSEEINFQVTVNGPGSNYQNLGLDPSHKRYFINEVNQNDEAVKLELIEPPPPAALPQSLPADTAGPVALAGGTNEDLSNITPLDYIEALETLAQIDEVSIVAVPGVTLTPVQQAVISHCEQMADRFGVLDSEPGTVQLDLDAVELQRNSLDSTRGYAAFYFPWLKVISAETGTPIFVPPSGHVCGLMARVDTFKGVHKAPANETIKRASAVRTTMSDQEQGLLNLRGINVIRVFREGGPPVLWGARTTATDLNWMYVNIRRLFLYIEESIQEGIRWAVFEPNNLELWQKLRRTITEFLTRVWRDGALFGATAEEAFYVRIDEALNPFSEQALGRLHIEIGLRPTYPAEFIVVRIGIWAGGSEVNEG